MCALAQSRCLSTRARAVHGFATEPLGAAPAWDVRSTGRMRRVEPSFEEFAALARHGQRRAGVARAARRRAHAGGRLRDRRRGRRELPARERRRRREVGALQLRGLRARADRARRRGPLRDRAARRRASRRAPWRSVARRCARCSRAYSRPAVPRACRASGAAPSATSATTRCAASSRRVGGAQRRRPDELRLLVRDRRHAAHLRQPAPDAAHRRAVPHRRGRRPARQRTRGGRAHRRARRQAAAARRALRPLPPPQQRSRADRCPPSSFDRAAFCDAVERCKEYIARRRHLPGRAQPALPRAERRASTRSTSTARCA